LSQHRLRLDPFLLDIRVALGPAQRT
jgi:hypothetical protein